MSGLSGAGTTAFAPTVTTLLRADGWRVNHKRVERIWRREGLKVPKKQPPRRRLWLTDGSCIRLRAEHPNHVWAYDFMATRTEDGRPVKLLAIVDEYTRECLAIDVERRLRSDDVLYRLAELFVQRGVPEHIRSDNVLHLEVKRAEQAHLSYAAVAAAKGRSAIPPNGASISNEALLTIVIQGPSSGLDRTQHNRQPQWKLRALSTRSVPASTAQANGVLHWVGVLQSTADNPYRS